MEHQEADLVARILDRDRRALSQFYKTYTPKLIVFIRSKIDNPQDADEILSDTLFAFLDALRDFTGRSALRTFLYSIARHKIVDYYRRRKLKHFVFSRLPQLEALISPLLSPEDAYESGQLAQKIHRTLASLLPQYRTVLLLKYSDNLTSRDIAGKLSTSLKGAESVLFRARKAFVKAYGRSTLY
jgi:RNA polymerase sigma-70 factor, ECF subfamily